MNVSTVILTNAPAAYDYGYTTRPGVKCVNEFGTPVEVVVMAVDAKAAQYQIDRYMSGCYAVVTDAVAILECIYPPK